MTTTNYGSKWAATKDLSRVEIAKLIRADIKAAVKAGLLPKAKYSVTCESYSGGGSIDVSISAVEGIPVHNAERLLFVHANPHEFERMSRYSAEMTKAIETIELIHGAYNYDGSDIQADYFHVRYYGNVQVAWQYADAVAAEELAKALEARDMPRPRLMLVPAPAANHCDFLAHVGAI